MTHPNSTNPPDFHQPSAPQGTGFAPWQWLKTKRISYLTLPLLVMATITEFVILATGWRYQQVVCLPKGMGVVFFGIGPIGATILAVELLKLPLAVWTASRSGWQKGVMMVFGLPLICLLTFQLVKDMAVYEMGVALAPASQFLEQATAQDAKADQLKGELAAIQAKKTDREGKLTELAAKKAKAESDLEASLKRNDDARQDAISLTDYQKKELSEVEAREATIIQQFNADTEQINKTLAELRAGRETEVGRATQWNSEDARIDNAYKAKLADYTNRKAAYEKAEDEYVNANFIKRQLMKEPVDPGVAPVRESNTILKPTALAEIDAQIEAKEAELSAVAGKRRASVAQVEADAHTLREEFDQRSTAKREEADKNREQLATAQAALNAEFAAEEKQIDQDYQSSVARVDGIQAELDDASQKAESLYEAREAAIKNTQVHRIATTVEIVRGLIMGQRPVSIKATAKERGDLYTDQISMVRIWVYPVLAFIVAFLPTLMVEIGFSTLFEPEKQRPQHRLGFFGRRMHWLYMRAGRQKILRAERLAREVTAEVATRDKALAETKAAAEQALAAKDVELRAAQEAAAAAAAAHDEQLRQRDQEWVAKCAGLADSLSQVMVEKDALRDFQKSEIERQVQLRQNGWAERLTQMRMELDSQSAAHEAERSSMIQDHQKRLLELTEDCKTQVIQARRQTVDAELAAEEKTAKLEFELKEAVTARDAARFQLQQQVESLSAKLAQTRDDATREMEKAARQEKNLLERQQLEFGKSMRQSNEDFKHQLKLREQELTLAFDTRLAEEQAKAGQNARRRGEEFERQMEVRVQEVDARWNQEVQQREDAARVRLKQREQQLQAQADARLGEIQTQAGQELRRRELELERQLEAQSREADARLKQELQQKDLELQARLKQREHEFTTRAGARETELQSQWSADLRVREEEWTRQAESRVRATETRLGQEAKEKEEIFQSKLRQRDQQWQIKLDALRAEAQVQNEQTLRLREEEAAAGQRALRELDSRLRNEMQEKDEAAQARARQREQELAGHLTAQAEAQHKAARAEWEKESERKVNEAVSPFISLIDRAETERDEAKQSAATALSQVQALEKRLTEASSFLNTWKNGKQLVPTGR